MRHLIVLSALIVLLGPSLSAQTGLRGWHADGQTWLVWNDDQTFVGNDSYSIYRATSPITNLAQAERIGRLFPADWQAPRLKLAPGGTTWTLPDAGGGTYQLEADEAVFVHTPHAAIPEYFAVVKTGDFTVGADNTTGPIAQTLDPVQPQAQLSGLDDGHPYTVFALWVDGREDPGSGRPGFPVMANQHTNGIAHIFCVFSPSQGAPALPMPAVLSLHGGGGSYWKFRPSNGPTARVNYKVEDGLYVTFDNRLNVFGTTEVVGVGTRWFGYWQHYDRFLPPVVLPPDDGVIYDYTARRLDWVTDWLVAGHDVDPLRVSVIGTSMGGRGTCAYVRRNPDRVSAATAFVMPDLFGDSNGVSLMGEPAQNLATNLGVGIVDFMWPSTLASDVDLPSMRFVYGTEDSQISWLSRPVIMTEIDAQRWGTQLYWDERGHVGFGGAWDGAHFVGSPRHDAQWLTRFRSDRSYPAFSHVDHGGDPGQQPHPGDPVVPANGDPWGTWGGWFDWELSSLVDEPDRWEATVFLVSSSSFPNDVSPSDSATCELTVRRPQAFKPTAGTPFSWSLTRIADGSLLQTGTGLVAADESVTLTDLVLHKEEARVVVIPGCGGLCAVSNTCATSPNSQGTGAVMGNLGSPSLAADDFVLVADGCPPSHFGIFYYGAEEAALPFGDGLRCVAGPQLYRLPVVLTSPAGRGEHALDFGAPPTPAGQITAGSRWFFQFWYRSDVIGGAGFNLSDALSVCFCP